MVKGVVSIVLLVFIESLWILENFQISSQQFSFGVQWLFDRQDAFFYSDIMNARSRLTGTERELENVLALQMVRESTKLSAIFNSLSSLGWNRPPSSLSQPVASSSKSDLKWFTKIGMGPSRYMRISHKNKSSTITLHTFFEEINRVGYMNNSFSISSTHVYVSFNRSRLLSGHVQNPVQWKSFSDDTTIPYHVRDKTDFSCQMLLWSLLASYHLWSYPVNQDISYSSMLVSVQDVPISLSAQLCCF